MNTFPLWRNLQQGRLASYSDASDFSSPMHLFILYKAQIRPCLEYVSHLWRGASKHSLATLDAIQKRAVRLIDDSTPTESLDSLAHRINVPALSLFYKYYHGRCSNELKSVFPPKACFARSTRFAESHTLSRLN